MSIQWHAGHRDLQGLLIERSRDVTTLLAVAIAQPVAFSVLPTACTIKLNILTIVVDTAESTFPNGCKTN